MEAAGQERVRLLLLPASAHEPAVCTQALARPAGEGRLPRAPAALHSLRPPYVTLRACAAARGLAAQLGWGGGGGALFVLDTETTGLSSRDRIHQLAVLNVASGQLLTLLLRTCPRGIAPAAAAVCGARDVVLHSPARPTFGQVAPLLHAFVEGGGGGGWGAGSGGADGNPAAVPPPLIVAHNGAFDSRMLIGEWTRRGLRMPEWRLLDTLPLARSCVRGCADYKLGTLRRRFGVRLAPGEAEHDAGVDVAVLAQLLPHLMSGAPSLPALLEGRMAEGNGTSVVRTLQDVRTRMRGAAAGDDPHLAAAAPMYTCPVCMMRVVE
eukprot:scaffold2.g7073.t1